LVKIVQPAEAGVVKQLLVGEGDAVKAGQILATLDTTLASADKTGIANDLAGQQMQVRRLVAELSEQPMLPKAGDDPQLYAQVRSQHAAHRKAYLDSLAQEKDLLSKAEHERKSGAEILIKLEQTLPTYKRSAEAYAKLEKEGYVAGLAAGRQAARSHRESERPRCPTSHGSRPGRHHRRPAKEDQPIAKHLPERTAKGTGRH